MLRCKQTNCCGNMDSL